MFLLLFLSSHKETCCPQHCEKCSVFNLIKTKETNNVTTNYRSCTSLGSITKFLTFHLENQFIPKENYKYNSLLLYVYFSSVTRIKQTLSLLSLKERRLQLMKLLKVIFPRGSRLLLLQAGSIAEFGNFHCENPLLKTG